MNDYNNNNNGDIADPMLYNLLHDDNVSLIQSCHDWKSFSILNNHLCSLLSTSNQKRPHQVIDPQNNNSINSGNDDKPMEISSNIIIDSTSIDHTKKTGDGTSLIAASSPEFYLSQQEHVVEAIDDMDEGLQQLEEVIGNERMIIQSKYMINKSLTFADVQVEHIYLYESWNMQRVLFNIILLMLLSLSGTLLYMQQHASSMDMSNISLEFISLSATFIFSLLCLSERFMLHTSSLFSSPTKQLETITDNSLVENIELRNNKKMRLILRQSIQIIAAMYPIVASIHIIMSDFFICNQTNNHQSLNRNNNGDIECKWLHRGLCPPFWHIVPCLNVVFTISAGLTWRTSSFGQLILHLMLDLIVIKRFKTAIVIQTLSVHSLFALFLLYVIFIFERQTRQLFLDRKLECISKLRKKCHVFFESIQEEQNSKETNSCESENAHTTPNPISPELELVSNKAKGFINKALNHLTSDDQQINMKYEIDMDKVGIEKKLSNGTFFSVFNGSYLDKPCVIKSINSIDKMNYSAIQELVNEILLQSKVVHPNILRPIGHCWNPHICMVFDAPEKGTLQDLLSYKPLEITWNDPLLVLASQIASALDYLHSSSPVILHGDIRTKSILMSDYRMCKISDISLSVFHGEERSHINADDFNRYSAPELIQGDPISMHSDAWSFGVCLWEMATRDVYPINDSKVASLPDQLPYPIPKVLRDIIRACLSINPESRPGFKDINHLLEKELLEIKDNSEKKKEKNGSDNSNSNNNSKNNDDALKANKQSFLKSHSLTASSFASLEKYSRFDSSDSFADYDDDYTLKSRGSSSYLMPNRGHDDNVSLFGMRDDISIDASEDGNSDFFQVVGKDDDKLNNNVQQSRKHHQQANKKNPTDDSITKDDHLSPIVQRVDIDIQAKQSDINSNAKTASPPVSQMNLISAPNTANSSSPVVEAVSVFEQPKNLSHPEVYPVFQQNQQQIPIPLEHAYHRFNAAPQAHISPTAQPIGFVQMNNHLDMAAPSPSAPKPFSYGTAIDPLCHPYQVPYGQPIPFSGPVMSPYITHQMNLLPQYPTPPPPPNVPFPASYHFPMSPRNPIPQQQMPNTFSPMSPFLVPPVSPVASVMPTVHSDQGMINDMIARLSVANLETALEFEKRREMMTPSSSGTLPFTPSLLNPIQAPPVNQTNDFAVISNLMNMSQYQSQQSLLGDLQDEEVQDEDDSTYTISVTPQHLSSSSTSQIDHEITNKSSHSEYLLPSSDQSNLKQKVDEEPRRRPASMSLSSIFQDRSKDEKKVDKKILPDEKKKSFWVPEIPNFKPKGISKEAALGTLRRLQAADLDFQTDDSKRTIRKAHSLMRMMSSSSHGSDNSEKSLERVPSDEKVGADNEKSFFKSSQPRSKVFDATQALNAAMSNSPEKKNNNNNQKSTMALQVTRSLENFKTSMEEMVTMTKKPKKNMSGHISFIAPDLPAVNEDSEDKPHT